MLDRLRLSIPFRPEFVAGGYRYLDADSGIRDGFVGHLFDVKQFGTPLRVSLLPIGEGQYEQSDLKAPIESLPSSFTPMGMAIHMGGNMWPCVELRASPAKLLQGHNLFGPNSIRLGAEEMLGILAANYPLLFDALEIRSTQVWELDSTFGVHLDTDEICRQVLECLKFASHGQTKSRGDSYDTTAYWGAKESRLKKLKAYLKSEEFLKQLSDYKRLAKSDYGYHNLVEICSDERLINYAKRMIRFEATIKSRYLERRNISTNLWQLCHYQESLLSQNRCLLQELHNQSFSDVFQSFEGMTMRVHNDEDVLNKLKVSLGRVGKGGKISYACALAAFRTYRMIGEDGWDATLDSMSRTTFYRHVNQICDSGVSHAYLRSLRSLRSTRVKNNVYPLLRFINIDFGNQYPEWYVEPKSQFSKVA